MANALLIATPRVPPVVALRDGISLRPLSRMDSTAVARAYHQTYVGTPDEMTADEARAEIDRTWAGEYGDVIDDASFGVVVDGELVGVIITVLDPPWEDVPRGPFILDLFVVPQHRRAGLGRALVAGVLSTVDTPIALRVDDSALEARALYASLGFTPAG